MILILVYAVFWKAAGKSGSLWGKLRKGCREASSLNIALWSQRLSKSQTEDKINASESTQRCGTGGDLGEIETSLEHWANPELYRLEHLAIKGIYQIPIIAEWVEPHCHWQPRSREGSLTALRSPAPLRPQTHCLQWPRRGDSLHARHWWARKEDVDYHSGTKKTMPFSAA